MCEANAYLVWDDQEELLLERVDEVIPEGDTLRLKNIFGEQRLVKGSIKEMRLVDHKILIEKKA